MPTILVVDDEPMIVRLLDQLLTNRGYVVRTAVRVQEALEQTLAYAGTIDLLVTDLRMPDGDGYSLAMELQAGRPSLRVLMISAWVEAEISVRGRSGWRFLAKPFQLEQFMQAVQNLLSNSPAVKAGASDAGRDPGCAC